jgi:hypothetical protein
VQVVERARFEAEETAVDPMLRARLLAEAGDATILPVELCDAELQLGAYDCHARQSAVF